MANRDGQADKIAIPPETISLDQASEGAAYFVWGAEFDTAGLEEIAVIVEPSRAITGSDDIRFTVHDAAVAGGPYTEVDEIKVLPTYRQETNRNVIEPNAGRAQIWGVVDTKRYIEIGFNGVAIDTSDVDLVVTVVARPDQLPGYLQTDPDAPNTPSTLP